MKKRKKNTVNAWQLLSSLNLVARLIIILLIVAAIGVAVWLNHDNHIGVSTDQRIDITPVQIESIQQIGQWEFLSISDEELVDTVAKGFFGDSELVRIYYGTLRLGIDMHKAKPQWLQATDSVVVATLPPIELLDRNFIDEARTQSFFEDGKWSQTDRERLYKTAYRKMLRRCMTKQNIATAEANGKEQFTKLLHSMGFQNVRVEFEAKQQKE